MALPFISVIVTTYNWPAALSCVLSGLANQSYKHFEVIIADDGSTEETAQIVHFWKSHSDLTIMHCWQPDEGFRAAMIRNRAVAKARFPYLIFLDGDCIPPINFLQRHARLAEKGWFVAGNRILLEEPFTQQVLKEQLKIEQWSLPKWSMAAWEKKCNRVTPLIALPLGSLRKITKNKWQGAKTCNLGVWRDDYLAVNGMDESYTGWGFEDSDLIVRLQRAKVYHKTGKFAVPVLHLWHPEHDRAGVKQNAERLQQLFHSSRMKALTGINQYWDHNDYHSS